MVKRYHYQVLVYSRERDYREGHVDDVLAMIDILEASAAKNFTKQTVDTDTVQRAYSLAKAVNARLPVWARQGWRRELLYLRATLDRERFVGAGLATPAAEAALRRLIEIYHGQMKTNDPYHHRVRPPLK